MAEKLYFHPSYLKNREHYARHRDWIKSQPDVLARFLEMSFLEAHEDGGKECFAERKALLDVDNQIRSLLTIHLSELVEDEPSWNGLDHPQAEIILDDIDGKGTTTWKFTQNVAYRLLSLGAAVVETFSPPTKGRSLGEARELGERSFSRLYEPDDVVAWEYFDDDEERRGQLKSITLLNKVVLEKQTKKQTYKRYEMVDGRYTTQILRAKQSLWLARDREAVEVEPDPERGELKQGELDFIPVTIFGDLDDGVEDTVIFAACYDAIVLLNKQSMYDTTTRYNHYPRHIISGSDNPEQDTVTLPSTGMGVVTARNLQVHTLAAADPIALWRDIRRLEESIRHKVLLEVNQANAESKESPSVDSKRADAEARKKFYNAITDVLEQGLKRLFGKAHAGFEGGIIPVGGVEILFRRDFSLKDHQMEIEEQTLRWTRAGSMGEAGAEYRKRLFVNDLIETKFKTSGEDESEEEIRAKLIEQVKTQREIQSSPLVMALQRRQVGLAQQPMADNPDKFEQAASA